MRALAAVYRGAILGAADERYSTRQLMAWASYADGPEFERWLRRAWTVVAMPKGSTPVGFGGLEPGGRIAS